MQDRTNPARPGCYGLRGRCYFAGAVARSMGACVGASGAVARSVAARAGAAIALVGLAVLAGRVSSPAPFAPSSSPGTTATPSATAVSHRPVPPGTAPVPASASPSASQTGVPTLEELAGDFATRQGFG